MENNEKIKNSLDELFCLEEVPEGNLQLPTPYLVQYYKDKKNRVIWINKDIDDWKEELAKLLKDARVLLNDSSENYDYEDSSYYGRRVA